MAKQVLWGCARGLLGVGLALAYMRSLFFIEPGCLAPGGVLLACCFGYGFPLIGLGDRAGDRFLWGLSVLFFCLVGFLVL